MTRKFFGTDGIRGVTNTAPMTVEIAMKVGQAAGAHFLRGDHRHRVVIGKDTRLSGYMMESALVAGFASVGMDVVLLGPMPTPAVAMLTRSMRADLGVMISASHNKFADNGIKLFGPDGYKLSDSDELAIEERLEQASVLVPPDKIGRAKRIDDARGRYVHFAKSTFPDRLRLDGLQGGARLRQWRGLFGRARGIVGAWRRCHSARRVARRAQHQRRLRLDRSDPASGNRGRVGRCDRLGARWRCRPADRGRRKGHDRRRRPADGADRDRASPRAEADGQRRRRDSDVQPRAGEAPFAGTASRSNGRQVGDRYVLEAMRARGRNLGGEQSGHIILSDFSTTGDGLVAGLQVLAALIEGDKPASELLHLFEPVPQLLKNVRFASGAPLDDATVKARIAEAEAQLNGRGRLVIRKSGTEPLIRVMAEGDDLGMVETLVDGICDAVRVAATATIGD